MKSALKPPPPTWGRSRRGKPRFDVDSHRSLAPPRPAASWGRGNDVAHVRLPWPTRGRGLPTWRRRLGALPRVEVPVGGDGDRQVRIPVQRQDAVHHAAVVGQRIEHALGIDEAAAGERQAVAAVLRQAGGDHAGQVVQHARARGRDRPRRRPSGRHSRAARRRSAPCRPGGSGSARHRSPAPRRSGSRKAARPRTPADRGRRGAASAGRRRGPSGDRASGEARIQRVERDRHRFPCLSNLRRHSGRSGGGLCNAVWASNGGGPIPFELVSASINHSGANSLYMR